MPPRSLRSLPPEGAAPALGAALRVLDRPHARSRSLPPEGAAPALGAALRAGGPTNRLIAATDDSGRTLR